MIKVHRSLMIGLWSAAVLATAVPVLMLHQSDKIDMASVILLSGMIFVFSASAFAVIWTISRHKAHRAELAGQNRRFRDAFENLGQGLTMYDHDNKLVICNHRYHEIYGLDPEIVKPGIDLRGIASILYADKLHDVDFEERTARFYAPISERKSFTQTRSLPDGRILQVSSYLRPEGGWVVIHDDVTEREQARKATELSERMQRQQNRQFQDALENLGQGLTMYDHDNKLVICNRRYHEIYGLDPEIVKPGIDLRAIASILYADKLHDVDFDERTARFYAPISERKSFTQTRSLPDGRILQVTSYLRPEGGWVVIHDDVTSREQSRKALELSERVQRQQNRQFQDALENLGQGLTMYDSDNKLVICNRRYHEIYGLDPEIVRPGIDLRGIASILYADKLHDVDFDERTARFYAPLSERKSFVQTRSTPEGRTFQVTSHLRPEGGWVVLHSDITEKVQAESEARQAGKEAEKLRLQEQAAVAASQAKSAFLAMMSHEIRTPMNAVIGLSLSLLDSNLNDEQRRAVEMLNASGDNLLSLLNNILDLSKLDAGKFEFEAMPFSLRSVIDHAVSIVAARAADKGLAVKAAVDADFPVVLIGDQTRLHQVILNLVTNAIKFTDAGRVEIAARCTGTADGRAHFEVAVRDTGIGLASHQVGKLFADFAQANASINGKYGGTGLGLAICKRIVEQMGGEIRVESILGVGTMFAVSLTLPIAEESALALPVIVGPAQDEFIRILTALERPLQILLAEDNATNQVVFAKLLQNFDVDISVAANGRLALEQASTRTFDIAFMDMRMPEMDGLEATRAIRALGGDWSRIPIIALTANAFADDVKDCRDAGMNDFIAKPIRKKTLIQKLANALASHPPLPSVVAAGPDRPEENQDAAMVWELPVVPPAEVALTDVVPILDQRAFGQLIEEIDADGVRITVDIFLSETVERLALLRRLCCSGDRKRIGDEAHTLKGASATACLRQLAELSKTLEHTAATITPDAYQDLLDRIEASFAVGRTEVENALRLAEAA